MLGVGAGDLGFVCLRRWPFLVPVSSLVFSCLLGGLVWLCFYGVGLSLICYWFISVAPVRGGTYFLCRRKER
jgi:hypothetical protein